MSGVVYVMCGITSLICVLLLARSYFQSRNPLVFWTVIGFVSLAINNLLLVIGAFTPPEIEFSMLRTVVLTVGFTCMLFGLIWNAV